MANALPPLNSTSTVVVVPSNLTFWTTVRPQVPETCALPSQENLYTPAMPGTSAAMRTPKSSFGQPFSSTGQRPSPGLRIVPNFWLDLIASIVGQAGE